MKRYLRNLWLALTGGDPFADEVSELKERLEKAGENVSALYDQLYAALNKWDGCQLELQKTKEALAAAQADATACKQLRSMQRLVENLRERVREKDAELEQQGREFRDRMEQVKRDYQQRIKEYNDKLEAINKDLKR